MKRILLCLAIAVSALSIAAQVTTPFDVQLPTWRGLLTSKVESGPLVFQKPNASSDNLIDIEAGEETHYTWKSRSMNLEPIESLYSINRGNILPYITTHGGWVEVEITGYDEPLFGWAIASDLISLNLQKITVSDLIKSTQAIAWPEDDGTYVIVVSGGYYGCTFFSIGKLKDGYVVCPYICTVEWGNTKHPGILNGKLGSEGEDLSKFTLQDVKYILAHADGCADCVYVGYGYEGEINWIWTSLIGTPATTNDNQIFTQVEESATYPGGDSALLTSLERNIRYPSRAIENNIQGTVFVRFVVEKDGSITSPEVIKKVDPDLDREALRVVGTLTKMATPGKVNGRPVRSYFSVPLHFRL